VDRCDGTFSLWRRRDGGRVGTREWPFADGTLGTFPLLSGEPPKTYLTRWWLQLGARGLVATSRSVAQIAIEACYESEASFKRAFKRHYGVPPARYRKNNAGERAETADASERKNGRG